MAAFNQETVTHVHHWNDTLFSFKTTREPALHRVWLENDQRPFDCHPSAPVSIASTPPGGRHRLAPATSGEAYHTHFPVPRVVPFWRTPDPIRVNWT